MILGKVIVIWYSIRIRRTELLNFTIHADILLQNMDRQQVWSLHYAINSIKPVGFRTAPKSNIFLYLEVSIIPGLKLYNMFSCTEHPLNLVQTGAIYVCQGHGYANWSCYSKSQLWESCYSFFRIIYNP